MKYKNAILALAVLAGILVFYKWSRGDDQQPPLDPRIAAYDKGPATIDVSKYPPEMQADFKLFSKKCSHCHTLARPINCDFALPDEWSRYVKRMMRKPDSQISESEAKKIYEFLVYDSKVRKKDLLEKKLKEQGTTPQNQ
jgi:hypothetical protein